MIEFMKQLAVQAGTMALADSKTLTGDNVQKKSMLDLVTDTDRKVEAFITGELAKRFPDYGIYGEEYGKSHADREYCFVIDPIDGTASFIHGLPNWCVSIGLMRHGSVEASQAKALCRRKPFGYASGLYADALVGAVQPKGIQHCLLYDRGKAMRYGVANDGELFSVEQAHVHLTRPHDAGNAS